MPAEVRRSFMSLLRSRPPGSDISTVTDLVHRRAPVLAVRLSAVAPCEGKRAVTARETAAGSLTNEERAAAEVLLDRLRVEAQATVSG
jgi:hypothetical protein